ncbi:MAG: M15 family metallopeptidase [Cyclobacteriaceae bacterium]|nr:M15 family metallopeptidase [Cyclobacteriaceae bacterium]
MNSLHFVKSKLFYPLTVFYAVFFIGCMEGPPQESGNFRDSDLVELITLDSTFHLDIRYATNNNFVGKPVYTEARAFLQWPAAMALAEVNKELKPLGYGLVIFDGYRPWSITKTFWDITPEDKKQFVANPKNGSRHNRGCAIDCSLYEISSGKEIPMPSEYDEMTERAYPSFKGATEEEQRMRDLLISKMRARGFEVYEYEWWHFDYKDWKQYRIQNIPFSEIK